MSAAAWWDELEDDFDLVDYDDGRDEVEQERLDELRGQGCLETNLDGDDPAERRSGG